MSYCKEQQLICRIAEIQKQLYDLAAIVAKSSIAAIKQNYIAGETISGGKAVIIDVDKKVYTFDILNPYHYDKYLGIAETAGLINQSIVVVTQGPTTVIGTGWQAGVPYYIDNVGYLSPTPPITGLMKQIGIGVNTNTLLVNPSWEAVLI